MTHKPKDTKIKIKSCWTLDIQCGIKDLYKRLVRTW